ncbi:MAG TPA: DNA-processing protein DprA, partial [Chthonomonadales bacterium]|nr:DNA-processing protein DprA [Chthonomonadales bacterium]
IGVTRPEIVDGVRGPLGPRAFVRGARVRQQRKRSTVQDNIEDTGFAAEAQAMPRDRLEAWITLANAELPGRVLDALLREFGDDPLLALAASDKELSEVAELHARHAARIRDTGLAAGPKQVDWLIEQGASVLWTRHPDYPKLLGLSPDPPPLLFVRGKLIEKDRFAVGIVGSRRSTHYGRAIAERFARELTEYGLTVVSGGAIGIDTAAHSGAINAGGRTLAVLGCGLNIDYPRQNRSLFQQIPEQGALISEYPPDVQPYSWRFPARNRIISGLSEGVLVVEAPHASGALITARFAVEQGRPVMAIPGNIDRSSSSGTNDLLKDGAILITETADILHALGMVLAPARPEHQASLDLVDPEGVLQNGRRSVERSPSQMKLLSALSLTPRHIDSIAAEAGIASVEAGIEMTMMELSGLVRRLPGNTYIRTL